MLENPPSKAAREDGNTANPAPHRAWSVLGITGLAIGLAGAVQMVSVWNPPRFGNAYWLFRVTGGTIDALALVLASLLAVTAYVIVRQAERWLKILAAVSLLLLIAAVALYGTFLSTLGRVTRMAAEANDLQTFRDSVALTSVTAIAAIIVFAYAAWIAAVKRGQG